MENSDKVTFTEQDLLELSLMSPELRYYHGRNYDIAQTMRDSNYRVAPDLVIRKSHKEGDVTVITECTINSFSIFPQ